MDIYIAKEHMDKLLTYVKNVADSKPRMYQKSKDRLRDIAETCQKVVQIISEILQEEILEDCYDDSSESNNSEILQMVLDMQEELLHLKQFVSYKDNEVCSASSTQRVKSNEPLVKRISIDDRKFAMSKYRTVLKRISESYTEFPQVSELCKLLYRWFETRFYTSMKYNKDFRYNIRRIPVWISDIIIVYSNHLIKKDSDEFVHDFYSWCDDLLTDNSGKFAVPYEVYQFDKEERKTIYLNSVVIWDILLDLGLTELCNDSDDLYVSESYMYDTCMQAHPEQLNNYRNYNIDPSVIDECGLFSEWRKEVNND